MRNCARTGETSVCKEDATLIRVAVCRILGALYCIGYDVVVASDVARMRTNGCLYFKLRDPAVDILPSHYYSHKFVCVAPYSTDILLLINIPKTMLEKVIKVSVCLIEWHPYCDCTHIRLAAAVCHLPHPPPLSPSIPHSFLPSLHYVHTVLYIDRTDVCLQKILCRECINFSPVEFMKDENIMYRRRTVLM